MKKKMVAVLLTALMVCGLAACGKADDSKSSAKSENSASGKAEYKVGICQLVQHESLDAATEGFMAALKEELGDKVEFDEQNAQNDSNTCSTIINGFVSNDVDLILANATPALQAAAAGTNTIPVLGTCVTEYGVALEIDDFNGTVGGNISGTADLAPLDKQAELVQSVFPDAKNVGLLYCSAEANSKYQVDTMKEYLEKMGYKCEYYAFSDSNDLSSVVSSAAGASDLIYVPTDNTVASNTGIIDNICLPAKVPVVGGDQGICGGCGTITICVDYYDIGYTTGEMAAKILTGESDVSKMPIEYSQNITMKYNPTNVEALGIKVPDEAVAIEK
ncbi:ABC-type uncharacterized transport system%2C periplasmic component [uncultured Roseburia sp.]|uniref:ABC transporter substrate-binding protein n=1 Tax=Brotonthovivens ammoniilytica TaxID=2981725 RepID=A0ABT2TH51_9FIRM|nr:ABC transporter substrate-binding protein [Brotonthovivens ammoniilytica]MCU6761027.1 ABC transporter substrate-binding protein [Brotonthovivens ammoniilytica]SCI16731.1 ABC-type uncharacterized transport system%2C periplasmic component [uncultured Roseburia sp.]